MATRLIYLLVVLAMACLAAAASSTYVSNLANSFADGLIVCQVLLLALAPFAVIKRKWLAAAACFAPMVFVALPRLGVTVPLTFLQNAGFRLHTSPVDQYLSTCKLLTIAEDERLQQIGRCESLLRWDKSRMDIVYDTSGKLLWPADRVTPEWKAAMTRLFPDDSPTLTYRYHLIGNFYAVGIQPADVKG